MVEDDDDHILIWLIEAAALASHVNVSHLHQLVRVAIAEGDLEWSGPPLGFLGWKGWPSTINPEDLVWPTATLDFTSNMTWVEHPRGCFNFPLRLELNMFRKLIGRLPPLRTTLAASEAADVAAIFAPAPVTSTLAVSEASDTTAALGMVFTPVTSTFVVGETSDAAAGIGTVQWDLAGEPTTNKEWCLWRVEKALYDGSPPLPRTKDRLAEVIGPLLADAAARPGSTLYPVKPITIQTGYFKRLNWPPLPGRSRQ